MVCGGELRSGVRAFCVGERMRGVPMWALVPRIEVVVEGSGAGCGAGGSLVSGLWLLNAAEGGEELQVPENSFVPGGLRCGEVLPLGSTRSSVVRNSKKEIRASKLLYLQDARWGGWGRSPKLLASLRHRGAKPRHGRSSSR